MLFVDKSRLTLLLSRLEVALQKNNLWSDIIPSSELTLSQQPFCCDTLSFEQWLQFVFIPRLTTALIQPNIMVFNCNILPMAEESFKHLKGEFSMLMNTIKALDLTLSSGTSNE